MIDFHKAFNDARTEARNASKKFMVRSLTKAGKVSKMAPTATDWAYCAATTQEEAERILASQQAMNPKLRFIIVAL